MRVALKNIPGVDTVSVSLEKGEAVATLSTGNTVRYQQLLRAIEKNGFTVKGSEVVADGVLTRNNGSFEFKISGSNEQFRAEPATQNAAPPENLPTQAVEITGTVPEVAKGSSPDLLRYELVVRK